MNASLLQTTYNKFIEVVKYCRTPCIMISGRMPFINAALLILSRFMTLIVYSRVDDSSSLALNGNCKILQFV